MRTRSSSALAVALAIAVAAGCSGAAESRGLGLLRSAAVGDPVDAPWAGVDPCALVTETEVERALSVTIASSRRQSDDPLRQALSFALPGRVCEYHGVAEAVRASPTRDASGDTPIPFPADAATRSHAAWGPGVVAVLEELSGSDVRGARRLGPSAAQLDTLELSLSVSARSLSRDEFDTRYERRVLDLDPHQAGPDGHEDISGSVAALASSFVDKATEGARDIGGIGDAARWYPATAQLDVLVGDVTFAVTSVKESPMMSGIFLGAPVDPANGPPPEFVEIARLAAERL